MVILLPVLAVAIDDSLTQVMLSARGFGGGARTRTPRSDARCPRWACPGSAVDACSAESVLLSATGAHEDCSQLIGAVGDVDDILYKISILVDPCGQQ